MALLHIVAGVFSAYLVREGNLLAISPIKLLRFIPEHLVLWRSDCLLLAAASLSFATFVVCAREIFDSAAGTLATLSVVCVTIAAANDLSGLCSMMVLFSDLSQQFGSHGHFLVHETIQLAWATMDSALAQCLLIGNTLYSLSGLLIVRCAFLTESFPKWLAWTGLPIWMVTLAVSVLAFLGMLQWVIMITMATVLVFVLWCTAIGVTYGRLGKLSNEGVAAPVG
jgi:hypothetical protein